MWQDLQPRQYGGNRGSGRAQVIGLQRHMPIAWVEWNMREDVIRISCVGSLFPDTISSGAVRCAAFSGITAGESGPKKLR